MAKEKLIPDKMYFRIGEVAELLNVKPYVLRYWETEFPDIKPVKSQSNQRLYKRRDVEMLLVIKELLYDQKFTINGARQHLKEMMKAVSAKQAEEPKDAAPKGSNDSKARSAAQTKEAPAVKIAVAPANVKKVLQRIKTELQWCLGEMRK
jgi:DNA-binding transcriptional MerR regulator